MSPNDHRSTSPRQVIFLDRDGTINVDRGYVFRIDDWGLGPGAIEAIRGLREAGYAIAVVTNQPGIGRGIFAESDFWALHEHVQQQLARQGASIDGVAFRPHSPADGFKCRKPATAIRDEIERLLGAPIDIATSWTVGDELSDAEFGRTIGTQTALIRSQYWQPAQLRERVDLVGDSLPMWPR